MDIDKEILEAAKGSNVEQSYVDFDEHGEPVLKVIQDVEPYAAQEWQRKKHGNDGWSEQRLMKRVGGIPGIFAMLPKYSGVLSDDKLEFEKAAKRFFRDHPEFMESKNV